MLSLETLVARLFEAKGCFVPAHHGGMMKDIDLFAHNDTSKPIRVGPLKIPASRSVSIQIKLLQLVHEAPSVRTGSGVRSTGCWRSSLEPPPKLGAEAVAQ